jgi:autotransporter-associated beta strand protein
LVTEIALSSPGQSFSNNFTINAGANNTDRIIAGLNTSGTSTYSGAITVGSDFQINAASGGTVAITGQLTGGATGYGLVKTGSGTVLLENSNNNYTGANSGLLSAVGTQIYGGTLGIYSATCLGIGPSGPYNNISFYGNGSLQDTSSNISLISNRNVLINTGVTGTFDNGGNSFGVAGVINGAGSLAATGTGTLTLTGTNTYSGGSTISAGTVNFGNTGALGSGPVTIGNATLQAGAAGTLANSLLIASGSSAIFDTQGNTVTLSGSLAGAGSLTKIGSGALILTTQGSLSPAGGGITLDAGTLGIYAGNNLGPLTSGSTCLTFGGNSTLQLEYAGGSGAIASGRQFAINSGVTATLDTQSYNNTDAGNIIGSGALAKIGSATLTLSGNDTYTGATAVTAGPLLVSGSLSGTVSASVSAGATLEVDGLVNTSATNTLNGAGAALQGNGKVGAILANGGTINPGYTSGGSSTGALTASGAVTLSGSTNFDIRLGLGSSGTDGDELVENGSGLVSLSGSLNLSLGSGMSHLTAANVDHLYYVILNGGSTAVSGTFSGLANQSTITMNGYSFEILYNTDAVGNSDAGSGHDVVLELTAIPEPEAWAMLCPAVGLFIALKKIRRKHPGEV